MVNFSADEYFLGIGYNIITFWHATTGKPTHYTLSEILTVLWFKFGISNFLWLSDHWSDWVKAWESSSVFENDGNCHWGNCLLTNNGWLTPDRFFRLLGSNIASS